MDSVDQFFDFVERGEHALINLNPHFVLVPIYTRIMPLFVHAVYSGYNFYTHIFAPAQIDFVFGVPAARKYSAQIETVDLGQLSSFYVHRGPIVRPRILARHRNDRHNHEILADALR